MARTRTTIRRIDPWSVLKFGFVANLVLLGVYLLVGAVAWSFVRRLQLVETVCDLARSVGYRECAVDGQALFDTLLVLGLLGVVIQTGVFVFLAFLANLIFDLVGGIAITLEDDAPLGGTMAGAKRAGVGSTVGPTSSSRARDDRTGVLTPTRPTAGTSGRGSSSARSSVTGASSRGTDGTGARAGGAERSSRAGSATARQSSGSTQGSRSTPSGRGGEVDDEPLFGR